MGNRVNAVARSTGALFLLTLLLALFAGCSKKRSSPTGPSAHPTSWMDENSSDFHGTKVAAEGDSLCLACHTVTAPANAEQAKALSCANTTACHAASTGPDKLDCESCHTASSGAHAEHAAPTAGECALCHSLTIDTAGVPIDSTHAHMDARVEVVLGNGAAGTFTGTTCTNANCHLGTSPAWTSGTKLDCNGCHVKSALPGAHAAHFLVIANDCSICHSATVQDSTTITDPVQHLALDEPEHVNVTLKGLYGGAFSHDKETCSGVYCHDILTPTTTPEWGGTTHLDCQSCHADASLPDAHQKHLSELGGDCSICHSATVSGPTTIINRAKHANKTVDVAIDTTWGGSFSAANGACDNTYCHSPLGAGTSPAWTSGAPLDCQSCHAFASLPGSHEEHLAATNNRCDYCHAATATPSGGLQANAPHINKVVDVVMSAEAGGSFDAETKTCRDTYCHGAQTTPQWGPPAQLDCNSCHPTADLPGRHAEHLITTGGRCDVCHDATVDASGDIKPGAPHIDGTADVVMNALWGGTYAPATGTCSGTYCHGAQPSTPAWTSTVTLDCNSCHPTADLQNAHTEHLADFSDDCSICHSATASGPTTISDKTKHADRAVEVELNAAWGGTFSTSSASCAGTYCHSPLGTGTSPAWTNTTPLGCDGCHPTASLPAAHPTHLTPLDNRCDVCHDLTATSSGTLKPNAPHINKTVDVQLNADAGGSYDPVSAQCSGTYCHGAANTSPAWTSATKLGCNSCHETASLPGAHSGHFSAIAANCSTCHNSTATDSTEIKDAALHANFQKNVVLKSSIGGAYDSTSETCSGVYCHDILTPTTTPGWLSGATLDCDGCHPKASLPDAHQKHLSEFSDDCSICHSATVSGPTTIINRAKHANETVDVAIDTTWGGTFSTTNLTCQGTYCHKTANDSTTPAWNSGATLDCQGCHPDASLPQPHAKHLQSYPSRCDICHSLTVDSPNVLQPNAPHISDSVEVKMAPSYSFITYDPATKGCSVGCHVARVWQ